MTEYTVTKFGRGALHINVPKGKFEELDKVNVTKMGESITEQVSDKLEIKEPETPAPEKPIKTLEEFYQMIKDHERDFH